MFRLSIRGLPGLGHSPLASAFRIAMSFEVRRWPIPRLIFLLELPLHFLRQSTEKLGFFRTREAKILGHSRLLTGLGFLIELPLEWEARADPGRILKP